MLLHSATHLNPKRSSVQCRQAKLSVADYTYLDCSTRKLHEKPGYSLYSVRASPCREYSYWTMKARTVLQGNIQTQYTQENLIKGGVYSVPPLQMFELGRHYLHKCALRTFISLYTVVSSTNTQLSIVVVKLSVEATPPFVSYQNKINHHLTFFLLMVIVEKPIDSKFTCVLL